MKITLGKKELEILETALKHYSIKPPYTLLCANGNYILEASDEEFINLRECCSDYLLIVGFDKDYNPNEIGRSLESLIDKLFIE